MGRHESGQTDEHLQAKADDFDAYQAEIDARNAEKPQDYPAIRNHESEGVRICETARRRRISKLSSLDDQAGTARQCSTSRRL